MYIPVRVINFTFVTNLGMSADEQVYTSAHFPRFVTKVKSITLTGIYISSLS
jgi:hypothetical protein